MAGLAINGERLVGQEVRNQNVMATSAIANVVRSSLGPVGLDKMLVDEVGDVTITNDGATILKLLEVEHPAAKILVELSNLQDKEVGDGTTSVVLIAAELIRRANQLVKNNSIHPTTIISGYQRARREACRFIAEQMTSKVSVLGKESILNAIKTSMTSKHICLDGDHFAKMALIAMQRVGSLKEDASNLLNSDSSKAKEALNVSGIENKEFKFEEKMRYSIGDIGILKILGESQRDSYLVDGLALDYCRAAQGMPKTVKNAKIALVDFDLRKSKLQFGIQVNIDNPENLEAIRERETELTKERIDLLLEAGVNVVLTSKGIDDMAMKYFVEHNCIAVRRIPKRDLNRIAKATNGRIIISMASVEDVGLDDDSKENNLSVGQSRNESVDMEYIGSAEIVSEERVGDRDLLFFKGCKTSRAQTLILRGANDFILDEIERSMHDALSITKRTLESNRVVPGGGAVEAALSVHLEDFAESLGSREQLAISEFADSLLVVPKTLASNGAFDAIELTAQLRAAHNAALTKQRVEYTYTGLDLIKGRCRDNMKAGVLEPAMSKIKSIRYATEAAVTILRIDEDIKMNAKPKPKNMRGDAM